MKNNQLILSIGLVLLAVVSRVVGAHVGIHNFAPVIAIGFVSGMLIKDVKVAFLIALLGQFLGDVYLQVFPVPNYIGFYGISQLFVYAGLIAAPFIGKIMRKINVQNVLCGTVAASLTFFVISNLGYFAQGFNGYSLLGLITTFEDALPFITLRADLIGSAVLFSAYFLVKSVSPANVKAA